MTNAERHPIQPEDLYRFQTTLDAQLSPDGSRVAYVVCRIDRESDEYRSAIWVVPAAGGEPVQFTSGAKRGITTVTGTPSERPCHANPSA